MTNAPISPASGFSLMRIEAAAMSDALDDLADILHACVSDGAAVSFILPFALEDARDFWCDSVMPQVEAGATILLAARDEADGRLVGTVQLGIDTPPNQPHRADLKKLLVHPRARRRGIARALIAQLEGEALVCGRSMITLDTRTGDVAEPLYQALGYTVAGIIPDYSLDVTGTRLDATTVFYKRLNAK
jgi:ribosomal protein S18 acetylase RimI-like enzyme